jgi:hypothetical protein
MANVNQSGTRLKANNYVGSDGSKQFISWHDTTLNIDCQFGPASDGTTRCMPIGTGVAGFAAVYFSDSGCSQPVVYASPKGCASPTFASRNQTRAGVCGAYFSQFFSVGSAYTGTIYTGTPANCTAQSNDGGTGDPRSTIDFYSLGSEIAPSTYVAATVQTDP